MSDAGYIGWTNYPTWCVALWVDNDEGLYDERRRLAKEAHRTDDETYSPATRAPRFVFADVLRDWITNLVEEEADVEGFPSDLLTWALAQVNWQELADHWIEE